MLFCIFGDVRSFALDPAKSLFQYNSRSWTRLTGLPVDGVNSIAQTQDGYLWLGSRGGVIRYDGFEFKTVDLPAAASLRGCYVESLSRAKTGGFWFGVTRGAYGFFDERDGWTWGRDPQGGTDWSVNAVLEARDGTLWVAGEAVTERVPKKGPMEPIFDRYPEENAINTTSVCEDSQGRVWLGTANQGLYCWQDGKKTKFQDGLIEKHIIHAIAQDQAGRLWLGTEQGLFCYDSQFQKQEVYFPSCEIRALLVDRHGTLWIGTTGHGLARFRDGEFTSYQRVHGLANDDVMSLAEDREGNLWVGTRDGLTQLMDLKFPTYAAPEGIDAYCHAVCTSRKGGIWVASSKGAVYFDGKATFFSTEAGLKSLFVKRVFEARNGDLYLINGDKEIEILSGGRVVARHTAPNMPVGMAEDEQGVVVSVGGDLYRVGTNYFVPYPFDDGQKPPLYWVLNMITGRDGSIWVACVNGICRIKGGTYQQWTAQDGLPDYNVRWICEDSDGVIWAGLTTGMVRLKDGKVKTITKENGLFDNYIHAIVPDDHGFLWVDSSAGISRVSRRSLNAFADGKTERVECVGYDSQESWKTADKYGQEQSGCKTLDGRIWFPTSRGVLMIDPANVPVNRVAPPVHVQRIRADDRDLCRTNLVVVQPGRGELEFHYSAVTYIVPSKTRFRYKLEGYDTDWVEAGNRRLAFYTNLKPGPYTFRVIACNADGIWNQAGDSVQIKLLPHFYQTAWFNLMCAVFGLASLGGIYTWWVSRMNRKQRVLQEAHDLLEAKVGERTADLAAANASLMEEVQQRIRAQAVVEEQKARLENEVEERKRMELEVERIHKDLMEASREAGKAEVASSVLHNVGNVLNSVNVSATVISDRLRNLRLANLAKAAELIHRHDPAALGRFLTEDEKGRQLPVYLKELARHLTEEQSKLLNEIKELGHNLGHIKEIVAMQQTYAKVAGVHETMAVTDLVESALKMHMGAFQRHGVKTVHEYEPVPPVTVDKHKVLQILVNILHNAKYACSDSDRKDKQVAVRIRNSGAGMVRIEVEDNGVGIAPENMRRIFSHGFTTRKHGHGFGLHSAALAARELGGRMTVHSDGVGKGATFGLEFPIQPPREERPDDSPEPAVVVLGR